mmetsp:Transcript_15376/g.36530  ORF Transcript_15376/g.36530 Transcript_15376/m.36530 type:complete len:598 (-) Transcript_15376:525-2318(-)
MSCAWYVCVRYVCAVTGGSALIERHIGCDITFLFLGYAYVRMYVCTNLCKAIPHEIPVLYCGSLEESRRNFLPQRRTSTMTATSWTFLRRRSLLRPPQPDTVAPPKSNIAPSSLRSSSPLPISNQLDTLDPTRTGRTHSVFAAYTLKGYRVGTLITSSSPYDERNELDLSFTPPPSYYAQRTFCLNVKQRDALTVLTNNRLSSIRSSSDRLPKKADTILFPETNEDKAEGKADKRVIAGLYQEMHVVENVMLSRCAKRDKGLLPVHRLTLESLVPLAVHSYRPGMHVEVLEDIDGRRLKRSYSVASSPTPHRLSLLFKVYPTAGRGMSQTLSNVRPGDTIRVRGFKGPDLLEGAPLLPSTIENKTMWHEFWPYCGVIVGGTGIVALLNFIRHQEHALKALRDNPAIDTSGTEMGLIFAAKDMDEAKALGWDEVCELKRGLAMKKNGVSHYMHGRLMLSRVGYELSGDSPDVPEGDNDVRVGIIDSFTLKEGIPFLHALAEIAKQRNRLSTDGEQDIRTLPNIDTSMNLEDSMPSSNMPFKSNHLDKSIHTTSERWQSGKPTLRTSRIFICGPQSFRDGMWLVLEELGIPTECLRFLE